MIETNTMYNMKREKLVVIEHSNVEKLNKVMQIRTMYLIFSCLEAMSPKRPTVNLVTTDAIDLVIISHLALDMW